MPTVYPAAAAVSRLRTTVVPTATTRPPRSRVATVSRQRLFAVPRIRSACMIRDCQYHRHAPAERYRRRRAKSGSVESIPCWLSVCQHRIVKMEPGGGCCNRARIVRIDGLVTLAIGCAIVALYIRRQRHVTVLLEEFQPVSTGLLYYETDPVRARSQACT